MGTVKHTRVTKTPATRWLWRGLRMALLAALLIGMMAFGARAQHPQPPKAPQFPTNLVLLRGSLHAHSADSDSPGITDPYQDAITHKMDFLGLSDHAEEVTAEHWKNRAENATANSSAAKAFVALRGFEWTATWSKKTGGAFDPLYERDVITNHGFGHINVFGSDDFLGAGADDGKAYERLQDWLTARSEPLLVCQFNHPSLYDASNHFNGFDLPYKNDAAKRKKLLDAFALIELGTTGYSFDAASLGRQLPHTYEGAGNPSDPAHGNEYWYRRALISGWRVAPSMGEDNHKVTIEVKGHKIAVGEDIGSTNRRTGVWVDSASLAQDRQQALLEALQSRCTYSTEDKQFKLYVSADDAGGSHPMGSIVTVTAGAALTLRVNALHEGKKAIGTVKLVTVCQGQNPGSVQEETLAKDSKESALALDREVTPAENVICYYIKITRPAGVFSKTGDTIISAPIWVTVSKPAPSAPVQAAPGQGPIASAPQQVIPTNTILVMDCSGSMNSPMPDGTRKLDAAKTAAKHYLDIINFDVTELGASHQVGIVSFSSTATATLPLTPSLDAARAALDGLQPNDTTNYGSSLDMAVSWLEATSPDARNILIFLTDGMTNTGPVAHDEFLVDTPDAFANPLHLYQRLRDRKIKVYTVGFGDPTKANGLFSDESGLDEDVLRKIAEVPGTGGRYLPAASAFELDEVYIRSFHDATGQVIFESTGTINPGATVTAGPFDPNNARNQAPASNTRQVSFLVPPAMAANPPNSQMLITLTTSGGSIDFQVKDPKGRIVDKAYPGAHIRVDMQPMCVAIDNPIAGKWNATLGGKSLRAPQRYQLMVSARAPSYRGGAAAGKSFDPFEALLYTLCGGVLFLGIVVARRAIGARKPRRRPTFMPVLTITRPGGAVERLLIEESPTLLGSDRRNHLVLAERGVAPFHAEIRVAQGQVLLNDFNTPGGTVVNKQRVTRHVLAPGDRIRIGETVIVFSLHPAA